MKKISTLAIICLSVITIVCSCRKSESTQPVSKQTEINIIQPYTNQSFKYGDTVKMEVRITAEKQLHGCEILILNANGDTMFAKDNHVHGNEIVISEEWVNTLMGNTQLYLKVMCTLDHEGNMVERTQSISIQAN